MRRDDGGFGLSKCHSALYRFILGLYLPGNALHVTAGRQGLSVVRKIFGLRFVRHAAVDEITGIEKSIGMQSRQGNRTRAYYRIHVRTQDGRKITAGNGIPGASRADAMIDQLRKALDLPELPEADTAGPRFEKTPASQMPAAVIASQRRLKRIRLLANGGATVLFFVIVFWQFRDVIFRLL